MQIVIDYAAHKTKIQKHTSNTPSLYFVSFHKFE